MDDLHADLLLDGFHAADIGEVEGWEREIGGCGWGEILVFLGIAGVSLGGDFLWGARALRWWVVFELGFEAGVPEKRIGGECASVGRLGIAAVSFAGVEAGEEEVCGAEVGIFRENRFRSNDGFAGFSAEMKNGSHSDFCF